MRKGDSTGECVWMGLEGGMAGGFGGSPSGFKISNRKKSAASQVVMAVLYACSRNSKALSSDRVQTPAFGFLILILNTKRCLRDLQLRTVKTTRVLQQHVINRMYRGKHIVCTSYIHPSVDVMSG